MMTIKIVGNGQIPIYKRLEFISRMEKILEEGGIRDIVDIQMCNKTIHVTKPLKIADLKSHIPYSSLDTCVFMEYLWNEKNYTLNEASYCHEKHYFKIIYAIYILYELYADDFVICLVDGKIYDNSDVIGWLNYLFGEQYTNRISKFDEKNNDVPVTPIDTKTFLQCNNDDFICLNGQTNNFSDEFECYLEFFKEKFNNILLKDIIIAEDDKIEFFVKILYEIECFCHQKMDESESINKSRYTSVMIMNENVFYYFINNIQDRRIQAFILLLSDLINNYEDKISLKFIHKYFNILLNTELRNSILNIHDGL